MYAKSHHQPTEQQRASQQLPRCANCDIEILWHPTVVQGKTYCCTGCAAGGPCNCDYSEYSAFTIAEQRLSEGEAGSANEGAPMAGEQPAQ